MTSSPTLRTVKSALLVNRDAQGNPCPVRGLIDVPIAITRRHDIYCQCFSSFPSLSSVGSRVLLSVLCLKGKDELLYCLSGKPLLFEFRTFSRQLVTRSLYYGREIHLDHTRSLRLRYLTDDRFHARFIYFLRRRTLITWE